MEVILNEERDTDSSTYIGFGRDVNETPKAQSHAPCFTFLFRWHKLRQEISFETFILKKEMHRANYIFQILPLWKYSNESKLNSIH